MPGPIVRTAAALILLTGVSTACADDGAAANVLTDPGVAARGGHEGATVLWGGRIVDRTVENGKACLEVAAFPLRKGDGRPQTQSKRDEGQRFLACQADAFDAMKFAIGNQATVTGVLGSIEQRVVTGSCKNVVDSKGRMDPGSYRTATSKGCEVSIPLVTVADSRAWPEPPTRTGAPTM
ncbi:MAG: Slp family lipoprotein [Rhodanobacteraceae bacterium]